VSASSTFLRQGWRSMYVELRKTVRSCDPGPVLSTVEPRGKRISASWLCQARRGVGSWRTKVGRAARRADQSALVGRRRAVSFGQETRARSLHLAASDQGHRLADAGAALDAAGRDRLAASGAHLRAADGGVNRHAFFIHIFFRGLGFWVRFFLAHPKSSGIPRAR